ncbi:MAG TPA: sigma-70 family RNA polymerase sigma factor [Streptosporangiaceae bacterium]|nr:sigma-70 family RNA polymerase sigma factor [Streptosporangiaceae bacterium]
MTFSSETFEVTRSVGAAADVGGELTALFHGHHLDLVRLATMLTGDRTTAEDVVQDAFERVHVARHRLADRGGVGVSYLRTVVINGCRAVHRRRKVARRHEAEAHLDAGQLSAEQEVICAERHREVAAALARLPRRRREVLVLRYYLELSEAEIAETLNISTGTVKSSAARGLAALAKTLREGQ